MHSLVTVFSSFLQTLQQTLGPMILLPIAGLGHFVLFAITATVRMLTPPWRVAQILLQLQQIGVKSVFVVCLVGMFTGMVLALQGYKTLIEFGSESILGTAVVRSLIMELGPVLAALMVTGRAGSAMAAELGVMRISEQIDALDTMNINPLQYLVSPRIAATLIALPLLTAFFDWVGIIGGYLVGVVLLGVNPGIFIESVTNAVDLSDVISGFIKALVFGFFIATISTYRGYYCDTLRQSAQGAKGVGIATTSAVVYSSVVILMADYLLTSLLF